MCNIASLQIYMYPCGSKGVRLATHLWIPSTVGLPLVLHSLGKISQHPIFVESCEVGLAQ